MTAQRVGSYEIVRVLARGGMAVVYLARQPALDREVALKQLDFETQDPALAQRFVREARLAAALDHPNVVTLFDFFEDGGVPYIAMEYVAGGSLRPLVGRLELPQVFRVLEGILSGLLHAEGVGIAHRDLKPENVLLARGGGVKIADFGIARAYNALTGQLTSTGTTIGTPAYMAPEQALDEPLGPYTDLYAVGVVAYELLAGRPPFDPGGPAITVLYCHVNKAPPPLTDRAPQVPGEVCEWVEWLLAKPPADRPASAALAWEALEEIAVADLGPYWRRTAAIPTPAPEPVAPPPQDPAGEAITTLVPAGDGDSATLAVMPTPPPPGRPQRRRRRLALLAGASALAGTAAVVALVSDGSESPEAAHAVRAAAPYDFDGDGRRELVLGMPGSGAGDDGVVVVQSPEVRTPTLVTPVSARLPRPHREEDLFGVSPASADFDRDGHADLAVGAPGRNAVAVLYGSSRGLKGARSERFTAAGTDLPPAGGAYGAKLLAGDLDADGYADLAIGAPGDPIEPGSGAVQILYGHRTGLRRDGVRDVRSPDPSYAGFGSRMRAGDVNGDRRVDLVEGGGDLSDEKTPGHLSFCPGTAKGPRACRALAGGGTSSLAVADVDGDDFGDIVQGDHVPDPASPAGGEVRLWRGGPRGPASTAIPIVQGIDVVPGGDEPGDAFGWSVDAGRVDADGYADIVVGAPGEDDAAGAVTVVRGGRDGLARSALVRFDKGETGVDGEKVEGERFGWSLGLIRLPGDDRLDLAVTARDAARLRDAILIFEGGPGQFAPGEVRASRLLRLQKAVRGAVIDRIRVGRGGGG